MDQAGLELLMQPGTLTYLGPQARAVPSTIDLVLGRGHLAAQWLSTTILDEALGSDHLPLSTAYSFSYRSNFSAQRRNVRDVDWNAFDATLQPLIEELPDPANPGADPTTHLDHCAQSLDHAIQQAVQDLVPLI